MLTENAQSELLTKRTQQIDLINEPNKFSTEFNFTFLPAIFANSFYTFFHSYFKSIFLETW